VVELKNSKAKSSMGKAAMRKAAVGFAAPIIFAGLMATGHPKNASAQTEPITISWDKSSDNPAGYIAYYGEPGQSPQFVTLLHSACDATKCTVQTPALDMSRVWEIYTKAYRTSNGQTYISRKSNVVSYLPSAYSPSDVSPPTLVVNNYPAFTARPSLMLSGAYNDDNSANLSINGKHVTSEKGEWAYSLPLQKGQNNIEVKAVDIYGNLSINNGTTYYDPDSPAVSNLELLVDETNPSQPKLTLNSYIFEATNAQTEIYLNDKLIKKISSLPTTGDLQIDKLPIEYLVDGINRFKIVSKDLAGNQTTFEQDIKALLGFHAIEAAETYADDAKLRESWKNKTSSKGSLDARLTGNTESVTDGEKAIELAFNQQIPANGYVYWDRLLPNQLNLNNFLEFGMDIFNPRDGGDISLKLEFRNNTSTGYTYYSGAQLAHGMNNIKIPYEQLKDSGTVDRKTVDHIRFALFNRGTQTVVPETGKDNVSIDRFYALYKDILDNAEGYNTSSEAANAWKNMTINKGSLDASLTTDQTRISEGTKAIQLGFQASIDSNKCVFWDYNLAAPVDMDQFAEVGFDIYNPRSGGDLAPKIEFRKKDGTNIYWSGPMLGTGLNKIRIDSSTLKENGIVDPAEIDIVRLAIFNRKSSTIVPSTNQDYLCLDNVFFKPRMYYVPKTGK
jgi:hypothetical protein